MKLVILQIILIVMIFFDAFNQLQSAYNELVLMLGRSSPCTNLLFFAY